MKISHILFISLVHITIGIVAAESPTGDHIKKHNGVPNLHFHKKPGNKLGRSDGAANTPTDSPSGSRPGTPANTPKLEKLDTPKDLKKAMENFKKEKSSTPK